ncbi:MAG: DUF5691 domain-containing protein [Terracidiphilus sp.]
MNARTLRLEVFPALLAGTGRQPLVFRGDLAELAQEDATKATLNALSLTGQALRFERPMSPPNFAVEPVVDDQRPMMPDRMRRPLLRLLNKRKSQDELALALAWAFGRSRVRPHPFDFPRMDAFVREHAEHLGLMAQHWAQQRNDSPARPQSYFAAEEMDETTWTKGSPGLRARFIADRRRQDATAARVLVEAVWAQESADMRVRLLAALETGLHVDDQPFLEGLGKDRAPRVRALAQRFLARLTGNRADHPALAACLERIQRTTTGLLKKRTALKLELPATVKEHEASAWVREAFSEVGFEELARALQLTEPQLVEAAEKDANLSLALALMAMQDRQFDLLEQLTAGQISDAWEQLSQCGSFDLSMMTADERSRLAGILVAPYNGKPPASYLAWSWMHHLLEGPAPAQLIEAVLRSPRWLSQLLEENKLGSEWMEILAALCPSSHRERLRTMMAPLDATLTLTALPLLEILDSLEKVGHHEE